MRNLSKHVGKSVKKQLKAAHLSGWLQLILATSVIVDVVRRFIYGSEPESFLMIGIAALALIANFYCIYLMSHQKNDGAHMKANVFPQFGLPISAIFLLFI